MPDQLQALGGLAGDDLDLGSIRQGGLQVHQAAVHLDGQGRVQQPCSDASRQIGPGGPLGQLPEGVVRKADLDGHGCLEIEREFYQ